MKSTVGYDEGVMSLIRSHPSYYIHPDRVFGIPILMFYTIYPGDDPTAPYPYIEDYFIITDNAIKADWVPESEVKRMEDAIFAAHAARGKAYGGWGGV